MSGLPSRQIIRTAHAASILREANGLLEARYGTPRLGNKRHPVSELVFIILSARTRGRHHEKIYRELRRRFLSSRAIQSYWEGTVVGRSPTSSPNRSSSTFLACSLPLSAERRYHFTASAASSSTP